MKKKTVAVSEAPQAVGPYSQGIALTGADTLIWFSGQIAIDPTAGNLVGETPAEQTRQICKNIDALLLSQEMTVENVVKATVFLTDMASFSAVNAVYADYFGAALPARSCVGVTALPLDAAVEIEILAAR